MLQLIKLLIVICIVAPPAQGVGILEMIDHQDAILIKNPDGVNFISKNADKLLVPASTFKLLTALAGIHYLGLEYKFKTEFYFDQNHNLIVKGYGDPFLISELLAKLSYQLPIKNYHDLILDQSYFVPLKIPGVNASLDPYNAPNGALCVNFNTVSFKQVKGKFVSAEPQTPLLPVVISRITASGLTRGRIFLPALKNENTLYAGHLLKYFLQQASINSNGKIRIGKVPHQCKLLLKYKSKFTLSQIITRLLEYSNNFIANQLLISIGAEVYGPPGTLAKGRAVLKRLTVLLGIKKITIIEGSGISHKNKISAQGLLQVLESFEPYYQWLHQEDRLYYKTGTLAGVQTRAGYYVGSDGRLFRFVIMVNTPGKKVQTIMKKMVQVINIQN